MTHYFINATSGRIIPVPSHMAFLERLWEEPSIIEVLGFHKSEINLIERFKNLEDGEEDNFMDFLLKRLPLIRVSDIPELKSVTFDYNSEGTRSKTVAEIALEFCSQRGSRKISFYNRRNGKLMKFSDEELKQDDSEISRLGSVRDTLKKIAKMLKGSHTHFSVGDRVQDVFKEDDEYFKNGTVVDVKFPMIQVRFDNGVKRILRYFHLKEI